MSTRLDSIKALLADPRTPDWERTAAVRALDRIPLAEVEEAAAKCVVNAPKATESAASASYTTQKAPPSRPTRASSTPKYASATGMPSSPGGVRVRATDYMRMDSVARTYMREVCGRDDGVLNEERCVA